MNAKGILIPIGGNEDKGTGKTESYTLEYIHNGILSRIVRESGGKQTPMVIITTASGIPEKTTEMYADAFKKLGCTNLSFLDIRSREEADHPDCLSLVKKATCVMFTGGDQSKIVRYIKETELHDIMREKYINDRFVIAGTSAGAMCMSEEMIKGGGHKDILNKGAVLMGKGMGFLPHLIIDSHFIRRHRFGRLAEAVARFPDLVGIGLSEDTGLIIKNQFECEVIGSGMLIVFDPRKLTHNNQKKIEKGAPISIADLKIHILTSGDAMKLEDTEVLISLGYPESQNQINLF